MKYFFLLSFVFSLLLLCAHGFISRCIAQFNSNVEGKIRLFEESTLASVTFDKEKRSSLSVENVLQIHLSCSGSRRLS